MLFMLAEQKTLEKAHSEPLCPANFMAVNES